MDGGSRGPASLYANPQTSFRRNPLEVAQGFSSLDPSSDHLPYPATRHSVTLRESLARPSLYKVERRDAPLSIRPVLPREYGNLGRKTETASLDCEPQTGKPFTRYWHFAVHTRICHFYRLGISCEKVMKTGGAVVEFCVFHPDVGRFSFSCLFHFFCATLKFVLWKPVLSALFDSLRRNRTGRSGGSRPSGQESACRRVLTPVRWATDLRT